MAENAAVTSEGYFVGRVVRAGENYAWVELVTSSSFLLAAVVDQTRDLGVVNGDGAGRLNLLYIPEERRLSRGMTVSTSLMNDLIPPGLPIGTIIGADKNKEGYTEMKLSAGAHLTQLYNVEVFTGKGGEGEMTLLFVVWLLQDFAQLLLMGICIVPDVFLMTALFMALLPGVSGERQTKLVWAAFVGGCSGTCAGPTSRGSRLRSAEASSALYASCGTRRRRRDARREHSPSSPSSRTCSIP